MLKLPTQTCASLKLLPVLAAVAWLIGCADSQMPAPAPPTTTQPTGSAPEAGKAAGTPASPANPTPAGTPQTNAQSEILTLLDQLHAKRNVPDFQKRIAWIPLPDKKPYALDANGNLEQIELAYMPVTDEDLMRLATVSTIRRIDLTGVNIRESGVAHLKSLPHLEQIALYGTPVTDAVVDVLMEFPSLKNAGLNTTGVTKEGMERLRMARPGLTVR